MDIRAADRVGCDLEEKRYRPTARRAPVGASLTQYRLYFLESGGKHINYSHEFEAEGDERAARIAEGWREGRGAELWAGNRKLKSWNPDK